MNCRTPSATLLRQGFGGLRRLLIAVFLLRRQQLSRHRLDLTVALGRLHAPLGGAGRVAQQGSNKGRALGLVLAVVLGGQPGAELPQHRRKQHPHATHVNVDADVIVEQVGKPALDSLLKAPGLDGRFRQSVERRFAELLDDDIRIYVDVRRRRVLFPPVLWQFRGRLIFEYNRKHQTEGATLVTALLGYTSGPAQRRMQTAQGYREVEAVSRQLLSAEKKDRDE